MKPYPRLAEMGVIHPEHITRYSLSSLDYTDYLSIVYDRPKNSVLPMSRTYRFLRVQQKSEASGSGDVVMKTNPALQEALDELRELVDAQTGKHDLADSMRDEIQQLEQEFHSHTEHLKALIDKMESS